MSTLTEKNRLPDFLSYLQKRMDFIAQVATSAPSWCLVTNCKNLIEHFNKQYCLINNIIRSHQDAVGGPDFEPHFKSVYETSNKEAPDLDIPHGEIGGQAFYTILENILRNTAKYGNSEQLLGLKSNGDGKLRFNIIVSDPSESASLPPGEGDAPEPEAGGQSKPNSWATDFYQVRIEDQLKTEIGLAGESENVVTRLNSLLSESLTDPATGVVKPRNWGMKEIKICSAYLRMVKQDQIDTKFTEWDKGHPKQPPIVRVSLEKAETTSTHLIGHLTYTLYLLRPKNALVVVSRNLPPAGTREIFHRGGVDFRALKEFKRRIEAGERPRHWFLILPRPANLDDWKWLSDNLNFFPPRVIILDCNESDVPEGDKEVRTARIRRSVAFMDSQPLTHPIQFVDKLWSVWVGRWWGQYRVLVRWSLHAETIADQGEMENWDEVNQLSDHKWIVFDHGMNPDTTNLFRVSKYHETLSAGMPVIELLDKRKGSLMGGAKHMGVQSDVIERQTNLRVKEVAALSVAVIDERVWLEKDGVAGDGVRKYTTPAMRSRLAVWEKRRVYIQNTNKALLDFSAFVDSLTPSNIGIFDFIIIHQGIIDSVKGVGDPHFKDAWRKLKGKARWLVIDSGRGQPEQARLEYLRWVEYSNLAECLIHYAGDKFRLAGLLWTLRASSKEGAVR